MILVSILMFPGSKNSMRVTITILSLVFRNGRQNLKWLPGKVFHAHKLSFEVERSIILVSRLMFSMSKNSMRTITIILDLVSHKWLPKLQKEKT